MGAVQSIAIDRLKPAPYNPRKITQKARAGLKASLDRFGAVQPPVWNARTGHIVGGNQRLGLLRESGAEAVDVFVVDLPLAEEKALNVALNDPHMQGTFTAEVQSIVEEIRSQCDDLPEPLNFNKLVANITEKVGDDKGLGETYAIMVNCKSEKEQAKLFDRLEGEGYTCRLLTT